ncbi:MAG: flagellar biosynthesis protein FliQ [Alkalispirochaetaceae bacterium]
MDLGFTVMMFRSAILQLLLISAPVLLMGMLVGLIVSVFQATTSIQEQTLTFVPKIAAILVALLFFGPWMITTLRQYTINLFTQIPNMVG